MNTITDKKESKKAQAPKPDEIADAEVLGGKGPKTFELKDQQAKSALKVAEAQKKAADALAKDSE